MHEYELRVFKWLVVAVKHNMTEEEALAFLNGTLRVLRETQRKVKLYVV